MKKCVDVVISVCAWRDVDVWKIASRKILENIVSKRYCVAVPHDKAADFASITPSPWEVISEDYILGRRNLAWLKSKLPSILSERAGWYLQQFIKIEFIRQLPQNLIAVIWDADTIPIKPLVFIKDEKLIFRLGNHYPKINEPYFDLIKNIMGMSRRHEESFISQCLPVKTEWVKEFSTYILHQKTHESWIDVIVNYISENPSACGFSEYETLGTFFSNKYTNQMLCEPGKYHRPSNWFVDIHNFDERDIHRFSTFFDYLAFDSHVTGVCNGLNLGCGRTRMVQSFDGGCAVNIDKYHSPSTDMVLDIERGLPFKNYQFTHIVAHNILEHVTSLLEVITEIDRVLKPGGILQIEVPHIGSYNHGTDITHTRGLTFNSFNFLLSRHSYLYPSGNSPFNYQLLSFNMENYVNGELVRETFNHIPDRGTYREWLDAVMHFEIPGTFGYVLRKVGIQE